MDCVSGIGYCLPTFKGTIVPNFIYGVLNYAVSLTYLIYPWEALGLACTSARVILDFSQMDAYFTTLCYSYLYYVLSSGLDSYSKFQYFFRFPQEPRNFPSKGVMFDLGYNLWTIYEISNFGDTARPSRQ